jgi:hypothetical protein
MDDAVDIRLALEFKTSSYISITRGKPSVLNKVFYEVQHLHLALSHLALPYAHIGTLKGGAVFLFPHG